MASYDAYNLWHADLQRYALAQQRSAMDSHRLNSLMQVQAGALVGIGSGIGGLASMGQTQAGAAAGRMTELTATLKGKKIPESLREELQAETDEWLKDIK